jgi:ketopantoate reductase
MSDHSKVLLVGGGGLGVIAALSLEASSKASVSAVLRSNYNVVKEKGYDISSCDHGELSGWRPTEGLFLRA